MKTTHALTAAAAVLLLALTGCTSTTDAAAPAASTVAETSAPTPTPTPESMTVEEAGAYYLETSCVSNAASDTLDAVLANPNATLEEIQAAGTNGVDRSREGAERMSNEDVVWPEEVQEDAALIFEGYLANASGYSAVANAQSVDEAISVAWPAWPEGAEAAPQRIRFALDLPGDTSEGCDAFTE